MPGLLIIYKMVGLLMEDQIYILKHDIPNFVLIITGIIDQILTFF